MSERLLIFAKAPRPGSVKTRLSPALTATEAAALYEASLHDVAATATATVRDVQLFHDAAAGAEGYFRSAFPRLPTALQVAGDLGARLGAAFDHCFRADVERVAIIGADSPTLPGHLLPTAFAALAAHDLVLGPTDDGGYYLVAIRREAWPRAAAVFEGIPWSTDTVLARTLARADAAGIAHTLLEPWYDVDRPEDLIRARDDAHPESAFARALRRLPTGRIPPAQPRNIR
jgi:uncharacterized protein